MNHIYYRTSILVVLISGLFIGCNPGKPQESLTPTEMPAIATPTANILPTLRPTPAPTNTQTAQPMTCRCVQIQPIEGVVLPPGRAVLYGKGAYFLDISSQVMTKISNSAISAEVSPDGKWLAYDDVHRASIVFANAEGKEIAKIYDRDGLLTPYYWIDNERIIIIKQVKQGDTRVDRSLLVHNPFTGEQQEWLPENYPNIYNYPELLWKIVLNPQLSFLVYPVDADEGPIVLWDIEKKKEITRISTGLTEPEFSPKGDQFVVTVPQGSFLDSLGTDLFLVKTNGESIRLTYFTMENYAEQKAYEWSPDGTKIAFFLKIGDEEPEVYQLAIIELITNKIINYCIEGMYVRWSPDGQYLLLTQDFYSGSRTHDAYLIRLEDGAAWKISEYFYVNGWMVEPEGNTPTP